MGGSTFALGLPTGIEVCDRGNGDFGGVGVARTESQTIGGSHDNGRDGGSIGYSSHPRRISPGTATTDLGRTVVWALHVAALCPQEVTGPSLVVAA